MAERGWHKDPSGRHEYRYWSGTEWSPEVADQGVQSTDELQGAFPPPAAHVAPAATSVSTPTVNGTTPPGTNGLAVASLVLSLLTLCGLGSLLGVIFGHLSLGQIKRKGQHGRGLAVAGLVLGYLGIAAIVLIGIVVVASSSNTEDAGVTVESPTTIETPTTTEADDDSSETTPTTAEGAEEGEPVAVSGFTKYEALGETWVSAGIVLTGLSGGSQELTISLLDAAGTPLATTSEYVGSDRDGGEVLVSASFTDNTPTVASIRVDVTNASSFVDAAPFPVTVASQAFDGNFWSVKGTATNDRSENIEFGTITCVGFKAGKPVAGTATATDTIVPGAQIAWEATDTFDPQVDEVRCQGEAS
jgi:hypothetical protein